MEKRWNILRADAEKVSSLQSALSINPVLCQVLVSRGIDTYEDARRYFRPQLKDLHNPWLMKDMRQAVDRILNGIRQKEKILVFGDYDVDGTTSVASLFQFLCTINDHQQIDYYIPHRYREGYGVSKAGIDHAYTQGFTLIIALDCGIKSIELIDYARSLGIDFIVCDHHLPDSRLPAAIAILNPKQPGCGYPYKDLCGCGVGFKLIQALCQELHLPEDNSQMYLDLVATAIAADIVPMTGENRVLAYYGLKKANENPNFGIKALRELTGLKSPLFISNLVFMIAPRINAAGRMDDARKAVQLFISKTESEALSYARLLHSDNFDRKEADKHITEEALAAIEQHPNWKNRKSTLVFEPHWHKGVVGIVASRLIEHYYRPTIVLTRSGEYASGSARSVPGFNLYEAVHACKDYLLGYGGHTAAAGMTLELDKIDAFREKFEEVVSSTITPSALIPEITIDAEVAFSELTQSFYNILQQMEPFGPDNNRPVFLARNILDTGHSKVVKEHHLRCSVQQGQAVFSGIGFGLAQKYPLLQRRQPVDMVFSLDENEWNDRKSLQLKIIDLRLSES